jgi:hypothetical protein
VGAAVHIKEAEMANTEQHDPNSEDPFVSLSQKQLIAIEHIANGASHTKAADEAGVCRETISRWKRVPVFEAELNRRRREVRDEMTDMVRTLDHMALQGMTERVRAGDPKAQTDWLRMRGLHRIDTTEIGPEDADKILDEQVDAHEQAILEEDRKLAAQRSFDGRAPDRYALRKNVANRLRADTGFDPEPELPRPDTRGAIFAATHSEAATGAPDVLDGPWSVSVDGLTWADLLALSDVLFEHRPAKMPEEHLGEELGQPNTPTGVFPLDPAVTERLAELDEDEVLEAVVEWSLPWPGRPPMELRWALEIIAGLTTLAAVLLEDQQLYLWTTSEEFTQTPKEV